jgi:hypothetical protein
MVNRLERGAPPSWASRHMHLLCVGLLVLATTAPQPAFADGQPRRPLIYIYDLQENMTSKCWNTQTK